MRVLRIIALLLVCVYCVACSQSSPGNQTTKESSSHSSATSSIATTTIPGSEIVVDTTQTFAQQVTTVCNAVDSSVFIDLLGLNPAQDSSYQAKFDQAVVDIGRLRRGFEQVVVPQQHRTRWQLGVENLKDLERLVETVSNQYEEYLALAKELETSKDLARSAQIIQRQLVLVGEYATTLSDIQKRYDELLTIGSTAGIQRCAAFTP